MLISNTGFVDGYDDDYPEYPDDFKKPDDITDWHATQSIQLCELYNGGFFDNTDHSWDWEKYDDEQDDMEEQIHSEHEPLDADVYSALRSF